MTTSLTRSAGLSLAIAGFVYACDGRIAAEVIAPSDAGATPDAVGADVAVAVALDSGYLEPDEDCPPPINISGFEPTWKAPAPFARGVCTNAQVDALMCQFDMGADQAACAALVKDKANEDCQKCMFTPSSAARLGPIVITGNLGSINLAGCVANAEGNTTDQGCGAKLQAADQCSDEACEANMPCDYDDGESSDAGTCTEIAARTVCASYATAAACADALLAPGGVAAVCDEGDDFLARATALAKLFCTGGSADASTDVTDAADAPDVSDAPNDG